MPERGTLRVPDRSSALLASKRGKHGLREQLDVLRREDVG